MPVTDAATAAQVQPVRIRWVFWRWRKRAKSPDGVRLPGIRRVECGEAAIYPRVVHFIVLHIA